MGFFEYLAFNNVDAVLMFIGFIGFIVTLITLVALIDESNFNVKMIKPFVPSLIIFCLVFFTGLLLPGEGYFREMRVRENIKTINVNDVNSKLDEIKIDLESIKDNLKIAEE